MKKQLLLLVMLLLQMLASADVEINVESFPDANFRLYLLSQSYGADGKITESEIKNIVSIDVNSKGITSLKGVEFFTALKELYCFQNQLTALDVSKNTALLRLYCNSNQLTALDVSKNTALTTLDCYKNQLTALDVSKNTALLRLYCYSNQLTALDVSKNTALTELGCGNNQLTTLDVSKNTALTTLDCYKNQLTALDVSKNTALTSLYCYNNQLTALDVSKNKALTRLDCYLNQIKGTEMDNLIKGLPNNTSYKLYIFRVYYPTDKEGNVCTTSQVAAANAKGWIPECYYQSGWWKEYAGSEPVENSIEINETNFPDANFRSYLLSQSYGTDGVITESEIKNIVKIDVYNKRIISLKGVEYFTALTLLNCGSNQLTALNVSKNTALTILGCEYNQLTTLDVSKNTALTELYCGQNQLTALDVSKNTALTSLDCSGNQLTALDISKNTALMILDCYGNQLTALDVSKNTALWELSCHQNQLTALDVSKNTALTELYCDQNQLTALDVSKNTALTSLSCRYNKLTALDVSKNTALTDLDCYGNQLTALDLSKNTALTSLDCQYNQLTTLDVSKNTALTELYCGQNQLTALDVSKNTALRSLSCDTNQLTTLDVSKNTALTGLWCGDNQLTALDVSKNTALRFLLCGLNQIKGKEMDNLINGLPNNTSDNTHSFGVYHPTDKEGNVCTTIQVAAAKAKGWRPLYYDRNEWKEYAGSEPVRPSHTLTYVVDGETYKTYSIKEGTTITPEPAPTKEGYTFSAWSEIPKTMPAHDVTVTGSFTINKYKLIYQVDGEVYRSYEIEYGATITPEPAPTKEGYTFSAWSEIPKTMSAKDVTVTGSFAINQYTITYMINNEVFTTEKVDYGSKITPPTPQTRDGYDFAWGDYLETMPAHDVTVTGSFTINKYNLIYQVDGEVYRSYEIEYGATITPEPAPTKEGYTFSGWSEIPKTMPAKDVTVTGSFTINKYKLIYQVDGEVYRSYEIEYGATITPEPAPTKEGHTFSAWSEIPKTMPAHDVTVTGSFTINQYTITYMINNEVFTTEKVDYGSKITPPTTDGKGNAIQWNSHPTNMPAYDIIIYGTCTTGIDAVKVGDTDVKIFSLDGKAQSKLQKGVNVVRMSNGVTKKVVVK